MCLCGGVLTIEFGDPLVDEFDKGRDGLQMQDSKSDTEEKGREARGSRFGNSGTTD